MYQATKKEDDVKVASKMPQPKGYKLLISPVEVDEAAHAKAFVVHHAVAVMIDDMKEFAQ